MAVQMYMEELRRFTWFNFVLHLVRSNRLLARIAEEPFAVPGGHHRVTEVWQAAVFE
jgi:hypothetical protein